MALEFICSNVIENNKKIRIPRGSNKYELDFSKGKMKFYYDNPGKGVKLNFWKIPEIAEEMDFEKITNKVGFYILVPRFYDQNGKLLKIGNREY